MKTQIIAKNDGTYLIALNGVTDRGLIGLMRTMCEYTFNNTAISNELYTSIRNELYKVHPEMYKSIVPKHERHLVPRELGSKITTMAYEKKWKKTLAIADVV